MAARNPGRAPSRKGVTHVTDGDMSRLPLWAQNKINYLKRDLDEERKRFASLGRVLDPLAAEPRGTISYGNWRHEIEIPGGDKVTFHFGDGREISVRFDDDQTDLVFQGSDTLDLHLQASNTIAMSLRADLVRQKLAEARASEAARNVLLRPRDYDRSYKGKKS